jgi:glucose-1-phosphate thymidylyltransferase
MKAIILAAGEAKRYGGNKVLTRYKKKSLLEWNVLFAVKHGITEICITINKKYAQEIIDEIDDLKRRYDFVPKFAFQPDDMYGPAAAIMPWKDLDEDFLLLLGDNYYEGEIQWSLGDNDCVATCMTFTKSEENLRFSYITDDNRIIEKPHNYDQGRYYIGFMMFKKEMLKNIDTLVPSGRGEYELTDFFNTGSKRSIQPLNMHWFDIARKEELEYV